MAIEIRKAEPGEITIAERIYEQCLYHMKIVGDTYVAVEGKRVIGAISIDLRYTDYPITRVHELAVLPKYRGKGVGRQLLDAVKAISHEEGNAIINLFSVNHDFYKANGFMEEKKGGDIYYYPLAEEEEEIALTGEQVEAGGE